MKLIPRRYVDGELQYHERSVNTDDDQVVTFRECEHGEEVFLNNARQEVVDPREFFRIHAGMTVTEFDGRITRKDGR